MMGYEAFWTWIAKPSEMLLSGVSGGITHARDVATVEARINELENHILEGLVSSIGVTLNRRRGWMRPHYTREVDASIYTRTGLLQEHIYVTYRP